jgi:DNA-binding MarR family transcriptional regulator
MEKSDLIREIIELQRQVDRTRRQYQIDVWMGLQLTIGQLKSLFFINNQGSTNVGKLAAALGVTPTNTTGIVDRLVKKGLVSRTEDAQDRRMLLLRATKKGEELVASLRERKRSHMSEILAYMNMDELATLAQGFASLVNAMRLHEQGNKDFTSAGSIAT